MDEFKKALELELKEHPWTNTTVELAIGTYFAEWAKDWIETNMSKECNNCETGYLTLKQTTVYGENQRLKDALETLLTLEHHSIAEESWRIKQVLEGGDDG